MSNYRVKYICDVLKKLKALSDATIVEEYTCPTMPRPVLNKMASVGIKSVSTLPSSRSSFRIMSEVEIRLLFPCGMGDNAIGGATEDILEHFTGLVIENYFVSSITCGETKFDSTAYAIRSNIVLHLELLNEITNSANEEVPSLTVGELVFPNLPDKITVTRPKYKEETDEQGNVTLSVSPREFTLTGSVFMSPDSDFFKKLNSLTDTVNVVSLVLPYAGSTTVRCKELEINIDSTGYTFTYVLVLIEKM